MVDTYIKFKSNAIIEEENPLDVIKKDPFRILSTIVLFGSKLVTTLISTIFLMVIYLYLLQRTGLS